MQAQGGYVTQHFSCLLGVSYQTHDLSIMLCSNGHSNGFLKQKKERNMKNKREVAFCWL